LKRWVPLDQWHKINIVGCTVGDDFFGAEAPIDPSSRTFVSVGRLAPQKGQLILVRAVAELVRRGRRINLVLVGDGELRSVIETEIARRGIGDHVEITGFVPESEVRRHLCRSRALVMPSFAEGLPMVLMEAFAVGRPIVSTYVAGIPELVRPGESGWLVPAGDSGGLASALETALDTAAHELASMARKGRDLTLRHHRTVTEGDRLESLFVSAIVEQRPTLSDRSSAIDPPVGSETASRAVVGAEQTP
jgi:glycosyltransferase involved in cell wall biosynthesis